MAGGRPGRRTAPRSGIGDAGGNLLDGDGQGTRLGAHVISVPAPPPGPEVVGDHVLAQPFGSGWNTRPPARWVEVVHEVHQAGVGVQREDVDRRSGAGHPLDLGHRAGDRLGHRRPAEERRPVVLQVGGRLAVGDHQDDRLGVAVVGEEPPGQHQAVLQVGALQRVHGQLGERLGPEHLRGRGEPDDLDGVLRKRVVTSECSAMAVDFAAPQVPRNAME